MRTATYTLLDGSDLTIEYDETAPCRICKLPVMAASMGGTDVCPWCDMGTERPDKKEPELYQLEDDNPNNNPI